jgi:hypothetical protein
MNIKLTQSVAFASSTGFAGDLIEMPTVEALRLIAAGYAVIPEVEVAAVADADVETAILKSPRNRKAKAE